jgi:DNA-3-methyladenine glycosylase II
MDRVGKFQLRLERDRFKALARSILWQQISGSAAASIYRKLLATLSPAGLSPESLSGLTIDQLRAAGVSPQKAAYLLDLARKVTTGEVILTRLHRASDEAIIENLTQIRGVGTWTAQMFLIFSLGRLDVFPHDDLGIRQALRKAYKLDQLPDKKTSMKIALPWKPFSTIASWYCWRSLQAQVEPQLSPAPGLLPAAT